MKQLRDYQQRAVDFLSVRKFPGARALCVCPAGGGKTIIGAAALAAACDPFDRIGWACNTREQVEQGRAALIAAGLGKQAWVRCVAGLTRQDAKRVDFLIIDEVHHLPAASWSLFADACRGVIWGLTATPKSPDPERNFWFARFWGEGNTITIPRAEVMAGGHLVEGVVRIIDVDTPGEFEDAIEAELAKLTLEKFKNWEAFKSKIAPLIMANDFTGPTAISVLEQIEKKFPDQFESFWRKTKWRLTQEAVDASEPKFRFTCSRSAEHMGKGDSVLILVRKKETGIAFESAIPGSKFVFSSMGLRKRRDTIQAFRDGSLKCMIATSLADEGLDVPRASVLFLFRGGKSHREVVQRTGRVMRPSEGKSAGIVYDFADAGASMAHAQHKARLRVYRKLGYRIEKATT